MSNPYDSGKGDPSGLFDAVLGKSAYNYFNKIKAPAQMGMSTDGSIGALTDDVAGLIAYVELLAFGGGEASVPGGPLGNKYFMQTASKCVDAQGKEQARYVYINNIPDGKFQLLPSDTGMTLSMSAFEGLIPGVVEDILKLNPMYLFQAFTEGAKPKCTEVTLPVGSAGEPGVNPPDCSAPGSCESHYVLDVDIESMDSSWFPPSAPKPALSEGFSTLAEASRRARSGSGSDTADAVVTAWHAALGALGVFLLFKVLTRRRDALP
jgi:hypothetical protein